MITCNLIRVSTMTLLRGIAMRAIGFVPASCRGTIHLALHAEIRHSFQVRASRLRVDVVIRAGLIIAGFVVLPVISPLAIADDPPPPPPTLGTLHVNGPCAGTGGYAVFDGDTFEGCSTGDLNFGGSSGGGSAGGSGAPVGGGGMNGGGGSSNTSVNTSTTTDKNKQKDPCDHTGSHPIETGQMAETLAVTLFKVPGEMGLSYSLYYTSPRGWYDNLGYWLDTKCGVGLGGGGGGPLTPQLTQSLVGSETTPCEQITFHRPDGSSIVFSGVPGTVGNYPEQGGGGLATLVENADYTYTLHDEDGTTQVYSIGGALQSITDTSGVGWSVTYDGIGRPTRITRTDGSYFTITRQGSSSNGVTTVQATVTDPAGNTYQYTYTSTKPIGIFHNQFRLTSLSLPGSPATAITYQYAAGPTDPQTLLTEIEYNGTPYFYVSYDSAGRATGTHDADGSEDYSIVYTIGSGGSTMTAVVTNPLGHTATKQYDSTDGGEFLLTSVSEDVVEDCGATTQSLAYDSNGNLTKTVDNDGVAHTYSYGANGQLQTETEAYGTAVARTTDYAWDPDQQLNRPLSVTVAGESRTSYTYNAQNRIASVTRTNLTSVGTTNQSLTTTYAYTLYSDGMVETMTVTQPSPGGSDHTTYAYDSHGNLTSVTDGLGHATTYANYNALGEVGKVVGPNGAETDYTYDPRGRVASKTTHPNGTTATWTYAYDGFGLLAQVSAPDGEVVTWTRDAEKRVKTITHNDKDGASTETFAYDANNDVTSDVVARGSDVGKSTSYVYDALGRIYQIKGSHGQVRTYAYDGNGNVLSVTNALGYKTSYAYDALNRVASETNAAGGVTSFTYDASDHVTHVTDPRGLVTSYVWDGLGQLWQQTSPDTGTANFQYDGYGRLASKTRADGTTITYAYDGLNRLTSKVAGGVTRQYDWDNCTNGIGRLCSAANVNYDGIAYSYSPEGWATAKSFAFSNGTSYSLGYSYDVMGHLTKVLYPDGNSANYYYQDGAVYQVDLQVGKYYIAGVTNIDYRPMDMAMSNWTSYNGLTNAIAYDSDLRPTAISVPNVESLAFTYDAADRITQITKQI